MKFKNKGTVIDGFIEKVPDAPQVFPTEQYQKQYDSIMDGSIMLPEYKKPQPTREQVRRMLIQNAKSQMFAAIEDLQEQSRAIADFVRMTEERAWQDAVNSWEKERAAYRSRLLEQHKEYARSMKPLLDNDAAYIEKKLARWLRIVELPLGFNVSYQVGDADEADGDEVLCMEIDGTNIREEWVEPICAYMAHGAAGVAIGIQRFHLVAMNGEEAIYQREFTRDEMC